MRFKGVTITYFLFLINILSLEFLLISDSFLYFILSWELFNFSLYGIVIMEAKMKDALKASVNYFILSAINSFILILGFTLIYLDTASFNLGIFGILYTTGTTSYLSTLGVALIFISLFFKLGIAPFHLWAPDLYGIQSLEFTSWLMIVPKAGLLFLVYNIHFLQLTDSSFIFICGLFSIIIGSLGLFAQTKIKELITYSSIGNMGTFLLIGLTDNFTNNVYIYILSLLCLFAVLIWIKNKWNYENLSISTFSRLRLSDPALVAFMIIILLSLAGLPPLIGFLYKLNILEPTLISHPWTAIILIIAFVSNTFNYLRLIFSMYSKGPRHFVLNNEWIFPETGVRNSAPMSLFSLLLPIFIVFLLFCY